MSFLPYLSSFYSKLRDRVLGKETSENITVSQYMYFENIFHAVFTSVAQSDKQLFM